MGEGLTDKQLLNGVDHVHDVDNWESTFDAVDITSVTEDMDDGTIMEIGRLKRLPSVWAARVCIAYDDDGEPEDWEVRYFSTAEEAQAALQSEPQNG